MSRQTRTLFKIFFSSELWFYIIASVIIALIYAAVKGIYELLCKYAQYDFPNNFFIGFYYFLIIKPILCFVVLFKQIYLLFEMIISPGITTYPNINICLLLIMIALTVWGVLVGAKLLFINYKEKVAFRINKLMNYRWQITLVLIGPAIVGCVYNLSSLLIQWLFQR